MKRFSPSIDIKDIKPVNENGKVLTTDDVELMLNLIDLIFMGQDNDDLPS